ncbi:hypothetical protein [Altererythrobacter sp. Root672]|uniref:hypothetical protein n=1 Tax=Altererythrobacter sp. Root672 TaxID=1736584 RepID=UPI000A544599|nr:hypothetical protein [Altererythrobacter sp. Root672]
MKIEPRLESQFTFPAKTLFELRRVEPLDWTCEVKSAAGKTFKFAGRFGRPDDAGQRSVTLKASEVLPIAGSGRTGWFQADAISGSFWFEVATPQANFKFALSNIALNETGSIVIESTDAWSATRANKWKSEAVGFCQTRVAVDGALPQ